MPYGGTLPIRPLIPNPLMFETFVIETVQTYDGIVSNIFNDLVYFI